MTSTDFIKNINNLQVTYDTDFIDDDDDMMYDIYFNKHNLLPYCPLVTHDFKTLI